ncbi:MAG: hypothetical protein U0V04_12215 [Spirosomataceae bacterium]
MDRRLKNPKGSHVYRMVNVGNKPTLKGLNVYRKFFSGIYTTPKGSHHGCVGVFYKHQIPSGLFLESIEADIQKGLAELKEWI